MININKLYNSLFYFAVVLILYLGANVLLKLGWQIGLETAPAYQKIFPQFYLIMFLVIITNKKRWLRQKKEEIILIFIFLFLIIYLYLTGNQGTLSLVPNSLLLAVLVSLLCRNNDANMANTLSGIIVSFLIINSSFAIIERLLEYNYFPFSGLALIEYYNISEFRSTAFQDHPLNNALITSIIMSFILTSDMKNQRKYLLFSLGFVSILCYNTRSTIIIWGIFFILFVFKKIFFERNRIKTKLNLILVTGLGALLVGYFLFSLGWGNRIIELGLDDASAQGRIQIWNIFKYYSFSDFMVGYPASELDSAMFKVGLRNFENYWLIYLFRFGFLFLSVIIFAFVYLFKRLLKNYTRFNRFFVVSIFLLVSSTNNSLATNTVALTVFILSIYAFTPSGEKKSFNYA